MKKILKTTAIVLMTFILTILPGASAFAEEDNITAYQPTAPSIEWYDEGRVKGIWEPGSKKSSYQVSLYKGSNKTAIKTKTVSGTSVDFSEIIAGKKGGRGDYYFTIRSTHGGSIAVSDTMTIEADMYKKLKARVSDVEANTDSGKRGWVSAPNGTWSYYDDTGHAVKNQWIDYKGKRYHISSSGVMQVGWQPIDGRWYYFDQSGALLVNTVTPDGERVNAAGERIDEAGNVVSSQGAKNVPASMTTLTKATISVSEKGKTPGVVKEASFSGGSGVAVESVSFSQGYESWKAGEPVTVSLVVVPTANYKFSSNITFSVRGAKGISSKGSSQRRTVSFSYFPKKQLTAPTTLYIDGDKYLNWDRVDQAKRYKVVITVDGVQVRSETIDTNRTDVSEYLDGNYEISEEVREKSKDPSGNGIIAVKVSAMASEKKTSYLLTSEATTIENLQAFAAENTIEGSIRWVNGRLEYKTTDDEKYEGWKRLLGNWYYFKKGYAVGPGWFQDKDGLWYYFDSECRMCTGVINDGKADYFMNDGSNPNLPLGAWKE